MWVAHCTFNYPDYVNDKLVSLHHWLIRWWFLYHSCLSFLFHWIKKQSHGGHALEQLENMNGPIVCIMQLGKQILGEEFQRIVFTHSTKAHWSLIANIETTIEAAKKLLIHVFSARYFFRSWCWLGPWSQFCIVISTFHLLIPNGILVWTLIDNYTIASADIMPSILTK